MAVRPLRGIYGRTRRGRVRPLSEINVTPFVDVMLVLLIVFMVTAPLLTVGVPVDLPKTRARALNQDTEPLAVTILKDQQVYLQNTPVSDEELAPKLTAIAENGYEQRIFVRADASVEYGRVMQVMGIINAAGFRRIGLVTETEKTKQQ
ncbi:MAG: protein TolR [Alphaproteobacteria bacterium]